MLAPQPPGGPGDSGEPVLIAEGAGYGVTGAYTTATKLDREPTDVEHATEPQTGRNFHFDRDTNTWVDSATGRKHKFLGYLCATSGPSATTGPGAPENGPNSQTPQPPGSPGDSGGPVVVPEAGASATGAFTTGIVLWRDPTEPQHATEPQTGRNFHFDRDANMWVDSASGRKHKFWGYVCSTSGASTNTAPGTNPPLGATPRQAASQSEAPAPNTPSPATPTPQNKSVSMSGFTPIFQLRGFGGASFINGNTPATSGFDGALLFPLGNRILVGPAAGFQWFGSSQAQTIGGGPPPSTFIHVDLGFKNGNFGGVAQFPIGGFQLGIRGGATVAGSTITQAEGFCGTGGPTLPAGCHVLSSTTTHDTVVGPFLGGYVSHSIFPHVGVFVGYDYFRLKDTTAAGTPGSSTGGKRSIFDTHYSMVVAGFIFTFGRHER